jgi:hypothetical protein
MVLPPFSASIVVASLGGCSSLPPSTTTSGRTASRLRRLLAGDRASTVATNIATSHTITVLLFMFSPPQW